MKTKPTIFTIHAGTFNFTIRVIITTDTNQAAKYINKIQLRNDLDSHISEELLASNRGFYCRYKNYYPVIWLRYKPKTAEYLGTSAHELIHGVADCMRWYGVTYARETEEVFAHLHSHLYRQLLKKCGVK